MSISFENGIVGRGPLWAACGEIVVGGALYWIGENYMHGWDGLTYWAAAIFICFVASASGLVWTIAQLGASLRASGLSRWRAYVALPLHGILMFPGIQIWFA
ncbi:MAG TPA: hypothetical protein VL689_15210 [Paraburkholderia sp.]|jgi:TRAP-type C4-dicarboxylate transport system permease small subunit|nr:hypothetical protein [Paraburkholderia sp.]